MKITSTYDPVLSFIQLFGIVFLNSLIGLAAPVGIAIAFGYTLLGLSVLLGANFLAVLVGMQIRKRNYENTSYKFDDEKVCYFDGFFSPLYVEIFYKRILEINLQQSYWQKKFGLGTILIVTNSNSGGQQGINLRNIENPYEIYEEIKKIVYPHIRTN